MLQILEDYVAHIESSNNQSLLARIYGIFTIKTKQFPDLDFIVMQNTVRLYNKANSKLTFDIKGSKTKRWVKVTSSELHSKVLKDMNLLKMKDTSNLLNLSDEQARDIQAQMEKDSSFLRDHNIMDYSLLLVIEKMQSMKMSTTRNTICSETHPEAYHLGIIDFLQEWNLNKKMERAWKSLKGDPNQISAMEPIGYQQRFNIFLGKKVFRKNSPYSQMTREEFI